MKSILKTIFFLVVFLAAYVDAGMAGIMLLHLDGIGLIVYAVLAGLGSAALSEYLTDKAIP